MLAAVLLTALVVIAAARLMVFPLYGEAVTFYLRSLGAGLPAPPTGIEDYLANAGKNKFSLLCADRGRIVFHDAAIKTPELLLGQARTLLPADQSSAFKISGFGPGLQLLAIVRPASDVELVLIEQGRHFAPLYLKTFCGGLLLVLLVLLVVARRAVWSVFAPLWRRLQGLEEAFHDYAAGRRHQRLPVDEIVAADGFLLVNFEFNRMADTISQLAREKSEREAFQRRWLAALAHDLNTPMTIIRGHAENLLEAAPEKSSRLSEILAQSLYMQALVDDFLTQARAENATLELRPERIELAALFDRLVETFYHPAQRRGVALVADDGGLEVWADPLRLRQILVNLLRNGLTHARGLSCLELLAEASVDGTLLIVQDNGSGLEGIGYQEIFQSGRRGAGEGRGWGLGLAVVRMLVEAHGGSCRATESPEGGLRIEVFLPQSGNTALAVHPCEAGRSAGQTVCRR